jgi:tyrosine-protein kinase
MENRTSPQARVTDYIRPLTSRWWLILVAVVVASGCVYAYYARKPNVYTATTLVFVQDPGDPVTGLPSPQSTDRQVANEAALLDSRDNAAVVAKTVGYRGTPEALLNQVSVTSKQGEDFVQISAQAGTATQAATIANAFASRFVSSLKSAYLARIADAFKLSQTQLAQTPGGAASNVQRANLLDQINRLQLALRVPTSFVQQVDAALPPSAPTSPKPVRNALFALILSLIGAIAVAYGLERFDRRLKNPEDMERAYNSPLLAVLPHTANPAATKDGQPTLSSEFRETFRILRTNVELASVDEPPRTIVVTSAVPGEGKSTVVRNLALAFREGGKRVAVVDLDLRHPALARSFGIPGGPGVTEVMRRELDLRDVTVHVGVHLSVLEEVVKTPPMLESGNGSNGHRAVTLTGPELSLVLSGARPANPPALLASERLIEVLDELRELYDIVLIDSAPVLAVTDTVPLLRYADALVVVGRLGVSTRDTVKRLMEFLARVPGTNLLGVVANDLPRLEADSYGYGYHYGRYQRAADDASVGDPGQASEKQPV